MKKYRRGTISWLRQRGFLLGNAITVTALAASAGLVGLNWSGQQAYVSREVSQGYAFKTLNAAIGNYMSRLNDQLVAKNPDGSDAFTAECSKVSLGYGASVPTPALISSHDCELNAVLTRHADGSPDKRYVVKNAFQPQLKELIEMGMLDEGFSLAPLLPVDIVVKYKDPFGSAVEEAAPNMYSAVIYPHCVGAGTATTCGLENKALKSLVFNNQPFAQSQNSSQNFAVLLSALGAEGAISGPEEVSLQNPEDKLNPVGEFRSLGRVWTEDNPIKRNGSYTNAAGTLVRYSRGVDGIVAIRNGYDVSTALEYTRRDGSSLPTANWNFNNKNLSNVANLEITGKLTGANGGLQLADSLTVEGSQSVAGNFKVLGRMYVNGLAEFNGNIRVIGTALFRGDATFEGLIKGRDLDLVGKLQAASIAVTGNIRGASLNIGGTSISSEGVLLGGPTGWGVTEGEFCANVSTLAQNTTGFLMICKDNKWGQLLNRSDTVIAAPGLTTACSPEGAAGKLPDGTLAICRDGVWTSTQQGTAAPLASCTVAGSLSSNKVGNKFELLVCDGAKWQSTIVARPRPDQVQIKTACSVENELALDSVSKKSLLICKNSTWTYKETLLEAGNWLGTSCDRNGLVALDRSGSGLVLCKQNKWSAPEVASDANKCWLPNNTRYTDSNSDTWWCVNGVGQDFPDEIKIRTADTRPAILKAGIRMPGGDLYYIYSEPDISEFNKPQNIDDIDINLCTNYSNPWRCFGQYEDLHYSFRLDYGFGSSYYLSVSLPHMGELSWIKDVHGGRPLAWQVNLSGKWNTEFWSRDATNENNDVFHTMDLYSGSDNKRWSSDKQPVIYRVRNWESLKTLDNSHYWKSQGQGY